MSMTQQTTTALRIVPARSDDMDTVRALFRAYAASVDAAACFDGFERELAALPGDCVPPAGGILLARDERGTAIGVVAFHAIAPQVAEMKRLFVAPAGRGRGLGRALVEDVLRHAKAQGHAAIRLSTLPRVMPAADALYRTLGFRPIPAYEGVACAATCYERALPPS